MSLPQRRHKRVAKLTRNIDLLSKEVILFPVCLDSPQHWFLVVALLPQPTTTSLEPCVVVLDSNEDPGRRRQEAEIVRDYLEEEQRVRRGGGRPINILEARVPQQTDGFNCGVFTIMFMERILAAPAFFSTLVRQDQLANWFFPSAVSGQRARWADTFQWLSRQDNHRRGRRFPAIQCEPPGQLQGLGCMLNLQRLCFTGSTILLMLRSGFDSHLDQTAVASPGQAALVSAFLGVAAARRNPANPPMSPGPFIVAVNGLGLRQYEYRRVQECAVELLETVLQGLHLAPGFLVSHQEVGSCPRCLVDNQQVSSLHA